MQDIIKKIIEIDHMAQKLSDEAIQLKKEAEVSVENDKKALREQYIEKARRRISLNAETEKKYLAETLEEISQKSKGLEADLKQIYTQNREKWVEEIYQRVTGR